MALLFFSLFLPLKKLLFYAFRQGLPALLILVLQIRKLLADGGSPLIRLALQLSDLLRKCFGRPCLMIAIHAGFLAGRSFGEHCKTALPVVVLKD